MLRYRAARVLGGVLFGCVVSSSRCFEGGDVILKLLDSCLSLFQEAFVQEVHLCKPKSEIDCGPQEEYRHHCW